MPVGAAGRPRVVLVNVPGSIAAHAPLPQKTEEAARRLFLWERPVGRDGFDECAGCYRGAAG